MVVTDAAQSISISGATLEATVNPNGATTTPRFQYSTTASFTPTVATTIGSGFNYPDDVALDGSGDVFVADRDNNEVEEVKPDGSITTIGSGFNWPTSVTVDAAGDIFVADYRNNAVKEVKPDGSITTIGSSFDGPIDVAVDGAGDVFVADTDNNAVKEVKPDGSITTIGSGFNLPVGVDVDGSGDVFVADTGNNAVKEVKPDGTILTIGSGFNQPNGVKLDATGDVFVADGNNNQIVELSSTTIAANPSTLTGTSTSMVSAALLGLAPGTTYYYHVVSSGAAGTVVDNSFHSFTTQIATSFANLTGGSVTFGAASVALSGKIVTTPSTSFPTGSTLTVSINNHPETASLNPNGSFRLSYQFTSMLRRQPVAPMPSPTPSPTRTEPSPRRATRPSR